MKKGLTLSIRPSGRSLSVSRGDLLADVLREAGIPVNLDCQKRGACGKCAVRILRGTAPPPGDRERALLNRKGLSADDRLACCLKLTEDLAVEIPETSLLQEVSILEAGIAPPVVLDPQVKKYPVLLAKPSLSRPQSILEILEKELRRRVSSITPYALRRLPLGQASSGGLATCVLYGGTEVLDLEPGDTSGSAYGLAVDLGTSTVVAELIDLVSGKTLDRASAVNSQISYGPDIVSRIAYAFQDPANLRRLQASATELLEGLATELALRNRIAPQAIYEIVVAGNPAMNHLLLGIPVGSLAVAPFHAVFSALPPLPAREAGLAVHPQARVFIVPNIKSFVGGDITAGLSALDLAAAAGNHLFIDLGTNGEIVLKLGPRLAATSTAAGPAFEGMSISCGMLAQPGAVDKVVWKGGFEARTIGGAKPRGVCGSGFIDLLAVALDRGFLNRGGKIKSPEKTLRITDSLSVTQKDVRELQLAAAAIKTGVRIMLRKFRIAPSDLNGVWLAGAFGSFLDVRNALAVGLIPAVPEDRIHYVGNASLAGARKLLLSAKERGAIAVLAGKIRHVSLASEPDFQECYIESMAFGGIAEESS